MTTDDFPPVPDSEASSQPSELPLPPDFSPELLPDLPPEEELPSLPTLPSIVTGSVEAGLPTLPPTPAAPQKSKTPVKAAPKKSSKKSSLITWCVIGVLAAGGIGYNIYQQKQEEKRLFIEAAQKENEKTLKEAEELYTRLFKGRETAGPVILVDMPPSICSEGAAQEALVSIDKEKKRYLQALQDKLGAEALSSVKKLEEETRSFLQNADHCFTLSLSLEKATEIEEEVLWYYMETLLGPALEKEDKAALKLIVKSPFLNARSKNTYLEVLRTKYKDPEAIMLLAKLNEETYGANSSYAQNLYREAAQLGNAEASAKIALKDMGSRKIGNPKDPYFEMVNKMPSSSQKSYILGCLYIEGTGVAQNEDLGVESLLLAAKDPEYAAMSYRALADYYLIGEVVAKNTKKAMEYVALGALNQEKDCRKYLLQTRTKEDNARRLSHPSLLCSGELSKNTVGFAPLNDVGFSWVITIKGADLVFHERFLQKDLKKVPLTDLELGEDTSVQVSGNGNFCALFSPQKQKLVVFNLTTLAPVWKTQILLSESPFIPEAFALTNKGNYQAKYSFIIAEKNRLSTYSIHPGEEGTSLWKISLDELHIPEGKLKQEDIWVDIHNTLWVKNPQGLIKIDAHTGNKLKEIPFPEAQALQFVQKLEDALVLSDAKGALWVFSPQKELFLNTKALPAKGAITLSQNLRSFSATSPEGTVTGVFPDQFAEPKKIEGTVMKNESAQSIADICLFSLEYTEEDQKKWVLLATKTGSLAPAWKHALSAPFEGIAKEGFLFYLEKDQLFSAPLTRQPLKPQAQKNPFPEAKKLAFLETSPGKKLMLFLKEDGSLCGWALWEWPLNFSEKLSAAPSFEQQKTVTSPPSLLKGGENNALPTLRVNSPTFEQEFKSFILHYLACREKGDAQGVGLYFNTEGCSYKYIKNRTASRAEIVKDIQSGIDRWVKRNITFKEFSYDYNERSNIYFVKVIYDFLYQDKQGKIAHGTTTEEWAMDIDFSQNEPYLCTIRAWDESVKK